MRQLICVVITAMLIANCFAMGAPKPNTVPKTKEWTVDVKYEKLQQIAMRTQSGAPAVFFYTILTVTNNTGRDVEFFPQCELLTDTFQVIPANIGVPQEVFDKIKARHAKAFPFLENLDSGGTKILEGEDNTRDIAIIFTDFDPRAKVVSIFVAGLSNETVAVENPNGEIAYLRKTLEMDYSISGDAKFRANPKITFLEESWVMR